MPSLFASTSDKAEEVPLTGLKVRIETPLFQEAVSFYKKYLGMKVLKSWDEDGDKGLILGLSCSTKSEAFLELAYADNRKPHEGLSLQFRVQSLAAIEKKLRGEWEFRGPEERPWGSSYLYIQDPTGMQVILYEGEI